jgi:hypothetical protein
VIAPSTEVIAERFVRTFLPPWHGLDEATDHGSSGGVGQGLSYCTFVIWRYELRECAVTTSRAPDYFTPLCKVYSFYDVSNIIDSCSIRKLVAYRLHELIDRQW